MGAFVLGIAVLGEAMTVARVIAALLIVNGIVTTKLASLHRRGVNGGSP
ncbi:hypothetical protein [Falsirhodobacter sp. 1013]